MICHCTLPYMNPDACKHCMASDRQESEQGFRSAHKPKTTGGFILPKNQDYQIVIKTKKITEIFDKNGNLIKRIVEEGSN